MRLLSEMNFYVSYNKQSEMWEVKDIQEENTHGAFKNKSEAYQYCLEMNE